MSAVFYKYFLGQWILGKIDGMYIESMVESGRLTREEADTILGTPRNEVV